MNPPVRQPHPALQRAWTFVELLVAISLSAIFLGAASLVMSSINANSKRLVQVVDANVGSGTMYNFYRQYTSNIRVSAAPNYGKAAQAQLIRDMMLDDADAASAVFALPRALNNTIRPEFLRYEPGETGSTSSRLRLDTPEAFRQFLAAVEPTSAAIYDTAIRNVPAANRPNTTIYYLGPESNSGFIRVNAVYEIDLVPITSKATGTYASVRRYKNNTLTHYYDVFFESGSGDPFAPGFVHFEREARKAVVEGAAIDRFKVAKWSPFTLVFLPDPAVNPYALPASTATDGGVIPRDAYAKMEGKTSFLVALPMFPNL